MTHLFICREYPPAAYAPGGIGTYVRQMAELLADAGEQVHVIAHRWRRRTPPIERSHAGRLIVHRIALDDPPADQGARAAAARHAPVAAAMIASDCPVQAFSWQAAIYAESVAASAGVDVIEAQEWEAPLYYLQLRRALGLAGTAAQPPCVVHLHSPSELIYQHNGWDPGVADYLPLARMEEYSIRAADALLCPSAYLADYAAERYGVPRPDIRVVPYPHGDAPHLDRDASIWSRARICYVGRLEARKGVLELADALGMVLAEHPQLAVDVIGSGTAVRATGGPSLERAVRARLPQPCRARVHFHGSLPRDQVFDRLRRASCAVVPARWENFPYTCIEAMSTGLPVVVSPHGGMRELVEDGVSGWVAAGGSAEAMAAALRRAIATTAADRARMGAAAERRVRQVCGNGAVVDAHLAIKSGVARAGCTRSRTLPEPVTGRPAATVRTASPAGGIGVVIVGSAGPALDATVSSASATRGIERVVVSAIEGQAWSDAANQGVGELLARPGLVGFAVLDPGTRLEPDFGDVIRHVLAAHERLGIVSAWAELADGERRQAPLVLRLSPDVRCAGIVNEAAPHAVIRAEAFRGAGPFPPAEDRDAARWQLVNAVLLEGWQAITLPAVLAAGEPASAAHVSDAMRRTTGAQLAAVDADRPWGMRLMRERALANGLRPRPSLMARGLRRLHTSTLEWLLGADADERAFLLWQIAGRCAPLAPRLVTAAADFMLPGGRTLAVPDGADNPRSGLHAESSARPRP